MKSDRNPATDVDYAVEESVREFLREAAPAVGFLGEEEGRFGDNESEFVWALDPVDGTVNFMHGLPLCGVSLGLARHRQPVLGVVDLPFLNQRYSAVLGRGAYRSGTRIRVADTRKVADAVIALGDYAVGHDANARNIERLKITQRLANRVQRVRMFGSAAIDLVWVADGTISGSVMLANKPWDTAAGVLIAREAGALVLDLSGEKHSDRSRSTVAVVPSIADELLRVLNGASDE